LPGEEGGRKDLEKKFFVLERGKKVHNTLRGREGRKERLEGKGILMERADACPKGTKKSPTFLARMERKRVW